MKCDICTERATTTVTWCSQTKPWTGHFCAFHTRQTWERCQEIGSVDGWSQKPIRTPEHIADPAFAIALLGLVAVACIILTGVL